MLLANLKISTKLILAFGVVLALVLAMAVLSHSSANRLGSIIQNYGERKLPGTSALWSIRQAETAVRANLGLVVNPGVKGPLRVDAQRRVVDALARIARCEKEYVGLPHGEATLAVWRGEYEPSAARGQRAFATLRESLQQRDGAAEARRPELDGKVLDEYQALTTTSAALQDVVNKLIRQTTEDAAALHVEAASTERHVVVTQWGAAALMALLLVVLGYGLSRSISGVIRGLLTQAGRLEEAVQAGKLAVRGDASAVSVEFQPVVEGFNKTLDAFAKPLAVTAECVDRIARGEIPSLIEEEYRGDFATIKQNLNRCITAVNALVEDADLLSKAAVEGRLSVRADARRHQGDFGRIVAGVNQTISTLVGHLDAIPVPALIVDRSFSIQYMNAAGAQVLGRRPEELVGQKCYDQFKTTDCHTERCACGRAMAEGCPASSETEAHPAGMTLQIAYSGVPVRSLEGRVIGALEVVSDQTAVKKAAAVARKVTEYQARQAEQVTAALGKLAQGDLALGLQVAAGDADTAGARQVFETICASIEVCASAVDRLVKDADMLAQEAIQGRLATRADAEQHQGEFAKVIAGVNRTLDAVVAPIQEAAGVLDRLAQRDLRARVKGDYQGDHAKIKEALNATAEALHDAMAQVSEAVSQVSSAAGQIAASSQAVASGASEQASSLEETSASLESMATMTKQAADSAQQANASALAAKRAAAEGGAAMKQMTGAMEKIRISAEGTSQIIKDINEIAFQTNLLALNAAVEAARAGEAGRGFAVVAEEVRSLALRSKEAANKTEALIRESVKQAGEGAVTAKHVDEQLTEITTSVSQVTEIVAGIAASAKEQAAGIDQVNKAVAQMDQVTQQNAASSEESSSAAAELSGQSEELAAMVAAFALDRVATSPGGLSEATCRPARRLTARTSGAPAVHAR